ASDSGGVSSVPTIQATVVTPTVMIISSAYLPVVSLAPDRAVRDRTSDVISEAPIANSSLHALTRHQYQRRISTAPVPAPNANRMRHPCSTDLSCNTTGIVSTISAALTMRDSSTCSFSDAPLRTKRNQTSFTRYDAPQFKCVEIV